MRKLLLCLLFLCLPVQSFATPVLCDVSGTMSHWVEQIGDRIYMEITGSIVVEEDPVITRDNDPDYQHIVAVTYSINEFIFNINDEFLFHGPSGKLTCTQGEDSFLFLDGQGDWEHWEIQARSNETYRPEPFKFDGYHNDGGWNYIIPPSGRSENEFVALRIDDLTFTKHQSAPVPEPSTMILLSCGGLLCLFKRRSTKLVDH